ncbi:MAG TPA: YncE family protein [Gaiellaceae bacterium]|nr:YncE family protein [Gaiellaceae bacterium]
MVASDTPQTGSAQTAVTPLGLGSRPIGIAIDAAGGRIYVTNSGQDTLAVLDLSSGSLVGKIPTGAEPGLVLFDPASRRVYVSNFRSGNITVVDAGASGATNPTSDPMDPTSPSAVVSTLPVGGLGLALDPVAKRIYAASGTSLAVIDATTSRVIARVQAPAGANLWGAAVDRTSNRVYLTDLFTARVLVFDGATDRWPTPVS